MNDDRTPFHSDSEVRHQQRKVCAPEFLVPPSAAIRSRIPNLHPSAKATTEPRTLRDDDNSRWKRRSERNSPATPIMYDPNILKKAMGLTVCRRGAIQALAVTMSSSVVYLYTFQKSLNLRPSHPPTRKSSHI